jgi:hypothetical protein
MFGFWSKRWHSLWVSHFPCGFLWLRFLCVHCRAIPWDKSPIQWILEYDPLWFDYCPATGDQARLEPAITTAKSAKCRLCLLRNKWRNSIVSSFFQWFDHWAATGDQVHFEPARKSAKANRKGQSPASKMRYASSQISRFDQSQWREKRA